ncbi:MAG: ribonuclease H-like domain-containing protein [Bacteroidetes bacterium]|nr:ribonuclease H-like domain-containing protein [Bacteroidota bacterium]
MISRVVFDIETLAYPFDSFDEAQQTYLTKLAKTEEERIEAIQRLSLTPLTAQVLAIGMLNPDTHQGKVFYLGPDESQSLVDDGLVSLVPCSETELLENFWNSVSHYKQIVTFNGRGFDCPFVMLRSALLGVKPTRNLMGYRYATNEHCDLLEQLSFYGATRRFNLDFYCKAFGITSPKEEGITGLDMAQLFGEKRYREIAEYCLRDVKATAELFNRWSAHLAFEK